MAYTGSYKLIISLNSDVWAKCSSIILTWWFNWSSNSNSSISISILFI